MIQADVREGHAQDGITGRLLLGMDLLNSVNQAPGVPDNRHMERNLWSGLASRLVIFGLVALLIYWAMPDSGVSAMKKMNASMQNARSWRVQTVVAEPTKNVESMTEVYCPSRVHTVQQSHDRRGWETLRGKQR